MNGNDSSRSFDNFSKAVTNLKRSLSVPVSEPRDLSGIIKDFEMAYELSWKVLKRILREDGHQSLGARDVFTKSYQLGYIDNEKNWLKMIEDRNQTSHVYDEKSAQDIADHISLFYIDLFDSLLKFIQER